MQTISLGHSALITHSGLQFGGLPIYVDMQEQDGVFPCATHWECGPHGEGMQGFAITSWVGWSKRIVNYKIWYKNVANVLTLY